MNIAWAHYLASRDFVNSVKSSSLNFFSCFTKSGSSSLPVSALWFFYIISWMIKTSFLSTWGEAKSRNMKCTIASASSKDYWSKENLITLFVNIWNTSWFSLSIHKSLWSFSGALVPNCCVKSRLKTLGSIGTVSSSSLGEGSVCLSLLCPSLFLLSFLDLMKSSGR